MTSTTNDSRIALRDRTQSPVYVASDAGYASEIAAFNTTVTHTPELVVAAASEAAVVETVAFARERSLRVAVQGAGHGGHPLVRSGILISTRALDRVEVDPVAGVATIGAGARWGAVVRAAAEHGLAPVTGSSPRVGVTGFLLGGGLGPLARSHGFGSDYLVAARLVTASGDVLTTNSEQHADVLWALRGGKPALGVITELRVKLVPLRTIYAGVLYFEESRIEPAFRAWIDWTAGADPRVSTSAAMMGFPPFDAVPPEFRGRRLLCLRFAFPGDAREGAKLATPLRAIAPVYVDALGEMPVTDIERIHNDPTEPAPVFVGGLLLDRTDQDFATAMLEQFDPKRGSPFAGGEVRHLGAATRRDVELGSAAGGRSADYLVSYVGLNPAHFESALPLAAERLWDRLSPWRSRESNINFMGEPRSFEHYASAWPTATFARLREIERAYDPSGMFKREIR